MEAPPLVAICAFAGIAALWLFVHLHSRQDIGEHKASERSRIEYGASKHLKARFQWAPRLQGYPRSQALPYVEIPRHVGYDGLLSSLGLGSLGAAPGSLAASGMGQSGAANAMHAQQGQYGMAPAQARLMQQWKGALTPEV
jgi:hypothetical protein